MDKKCFFQYKYVFKKEDRKTYIKVNFERLTYTMRNGKDKHDFTLIIDAKFIDVLNPLIINC